MHATGDHTIAELMEVFSSGRVAVCRVSTALSPPSPAEVRPNRQ
ncbi:hypothetical protein [Nonomuraea diastatica]|nr:hypothetical protein [Nonomuraea diastatica]